MTKMRSPAPRSCEQVYYELAAERARQGKQGEVALIRIEQLVRAAFLLFA